MNPLVIVPTYNEAANVAIMTEKLLVVVPEVDILFVDDSSPDGTGEIIDQIAKIQPRVRGLHRALKDGIGAAHIAGLTKAINDGYRTVITMDGDLTHSPEDIPRMLEASKDADVVLGSRYLQEGSLKGWNPIRKLTTHLAHVLTRVILGLPYDCTGAFRVYRMDRLPRGIFSLVRSKTYPFFFESVFVFHLNRLKIQQVPIKLPPRTYGSSKMPFSEPFRGVVHLFKVGALQWLRPESFTLSRRKLQVNQELPPQTDWDDYWSAGDSQPSLAYEVIAALYRRSIIKSRLNSAVRRTFAPKSRLLHAGCGSGQVDVDIQHQMRLTAVDTSFAALEKYSQTVPLAEAVEHASIFALPFANASFDGVYNLGVMEHFSESDLVIILAEFRRVLKPDGKLLIFWPHARASSVAVLGTWHRFRPATKPKLHPAEISLVPSQAWLTGLLQRSGFDIARYRFGWRDAFVQVELVAKPR